MSDNQKEPQYKLRWSEQLRDKVQDSAKAHNRSINAEICTRLEQSFESKSNDIAQLQEQISRMDQTIKTLATTLYSVSNRGST